MSHARLKNNTLFIFCSHKLFVDVSIIRLGRYKNKNTAGSFRLEREQVKRQVTYKNILLKTFGNI